MNNNKNSQVKEKYDVIVCGGGVAGISAALAAARQGKRVLLMEKQYILGGLATAGIVTIYLPLCDGFGHQVSFGIADELLRLSVKYGAEDKYPENWLDNCGTKTEKDKRFEVQYNPQLFALLAENLLVKSGVEILYGSYAVDVIKENDRIAAVITEGKSGREVYGANTFVDATGDCDIAYFAGAPTDNFKQGNVLASWYYSLTKDRYALNMLGFADIPDEEKTSENAAYNSSVRRFTGLETKELSEMTQLAHKRILEDIDTRRDKGERIFPVTIPTTPQIRMTRKIIGNMVLSENTSGSFFEDSVGVISNWKKRGPVYEIPFSSLYSPAVKNLITAGRCISVTECMWDITRVIPACAVTGEAAGTAAALSDDFSTLEVPYLQNVLASKGVKLHIKDVI